MWMVAFVSIVAALLPAAPADHDMAFWRGIVQARYAPPAGEDVALLTRELVEMLGSADPERRDDIAYSTLAKVKQVEERFAVTPASLPREHEDAVRRNHQSR
jgi:hypothetical protein